MYFGYTKVGVHVVSILFCEDLPKYLQLLVLDLSLLTWSCSCYVRVIKKLLETEGFFSWRSEDDIASIKFTIEQKGRPDRLIMLHVLTVKTNQLLDTLGKSVFSQERQSIVNQLIRNNHFFHHSVR